LGITRGKLTDSVVTTYIDNPDRISNRMVLRLLGGDCGYTFLKLLQRKVFIEGRIEDIAAVHHSGPTPKRIHTIVNAKDNQWRVLHSMSPKIDHLYAHDGDILRAP
jgi:hypothetical protein